LEDIYRKMYMKTIAAIREHMLYRPMTKDGRDILFSGSITTYGRPGAIPKLSADVEHLTCFVGGMVGMSAKIFGLDQDIEIAKKLADGCVWAYESFPSGIMAEGATVMPCENSEVCPWNETAYWEYLDPVAPGVREKQIIDYEIQKALRAQEEAATAARVLAEKQAAAEAAALATELPSSSESGSGSKIGTHTGGSQGVIEPSKDSSSPEKGKSTALDKREGDGAAKAGPQVLKRAPVEPSTVSLSAEEKSYAQKARDTDAELHALASTTGHQAEKPLKPPPVEPLVKDPFKPLSHKEFVERKIREQSLPPGFVSIKSRKYILRYV
jgi:mannosyl-oligosaccharide alpha-1,2-mannosidase